MHSNSWIHTNTLDNFFSIFDSKTKVATLSAVLGIGALTGIIGGPKVFPRISPKKTWAGVLAGWFAVGFFSWLFVENIAPQSLFFKFISISILLSVSAQIGDMIQSHLKRRSDVKDSSGLLPGHGGFMDRFDGFVGAMVVTGLIFEWIY